MTEIRSVADDAVLQAQARALGEPTRHAIFRAISGAGEPIGVAELNESFALNHNAIRQHLAKLVAADLVVETRAPAAGPGRPRLVYAVNPAAESPWATVGPFERLSRLLVEIIRSGDTPVEVGRRAADRFRVAPTGDALADITTAMARQGFDPELRPTRRGADLVLRRCPFANVVVDDRATVCSLHLGIAEGLAEGGPFSVEEVVAYDPHEARCKVRLRVADPASGTGGPERAGVLTIRGRPPRG